MVLHFVVWTILPVLTKPNYPLDVVECFIYGQEWALSSGKHPPLPSWMTETVSQLTGKAEITPYLCSQFVVFAAFFATWKIARTMLPLRKTLLAVCVMEFYTYFTFYSLEFNNSISLIGCWSLATFSFFSALERGKLRFWILTGLFLGLGCLAKYSGFLLVAMMLGFMTYDSRARKYWKTPGPYFAAMIAFFLFLPHFMSVVSHKFSTLHYLADRADAEQFMLFERIIFPIRFLLTQLGLIAPILIVFLVCCGGKFKRRTIPEKDVFHARFLNMLVMWPLVFQVLISAVCGLKLSTIYGSHIWIFLGLYLAFFLDFDETPLTWKRIAVIAGVGMILMTTLTAVRDVGSPYFRGKPSRIHYPGKEIAHQTEDVWHSRFSETCPNLAGEWWLTGCVAAYGNDDPNIYCHVSPDDFNQGDILSTWSDRDDLNRKGGICLWNENHYNGGIPPQLLEQYPAAEILPTKVIPFLTGADIPPLRLGMAIVPPPGQAKNKTNISSSPIKQGTSP